MPCSRLAVGLLVLTLGAASCGQSVDGPPPPSGPSLKILAGAGVADTISSSPAQGLVVQVMGEKGKPESGVAVEFEARGMPGCDYIYLCSGMQISTATDGTGFGTAASVVTDGEGRAVVRVRYGSIAGAAAIAVTVALYGLVDTARYTVQPGAAVAMAVAPRDTVAEVGASFRTRSGVADRVGNIRSDPVTYEGTSSTIQVDASGKVTALAIGRGYVRLRATVGGRALADSAGLTVVPRTRFAVSDYYAALYLRNLTGAEQKQLVGGLTFGPVWSPTGDRIVYWTGSGLAVTDTLGSTLNLPTPGLYYAGWPAYSADGSWIYFEGSSYGGGDQIYRVHPDGSGMEALLPGGTRGYSPAPSPDGTRVAFASGGVLVKTLGSARIDTVLAAPYAGLSSLRWSPDGQWLAYLDNSSLAVVLVHPDGTERRTIPGDVGGALTWSPDSRWLVVGGPASMSLIDPSLGIGYRLGVRGYYPAWRP